MKRGMYKLILPDLGEVARVHWATGDAAPYLSRTIYAASGFRPDFDALPDRETYLRTSPWVDEPFI